MADTRAAIIFDLDGTLVDSVRVIQGVANQLMAELDLPSLDVEQAKSYVGAGAPKFLERALIARGAYDPERFAPAYDRLMALYAASPGAANTPFPGVEPALRALAARGLSLGLCTNKPEEPARKVLAAHGWEDLFGALIGGDTLPERKPHPSPLQETARRLGMDRVIYVGDSEIDAETAERAGAPFLFFTEGYCHLPPEELTKAASFSRFAELEALVDGLL